MVESSLCPSCRAPLLPGVTVCATCGADAAGGAKPSDGNAPEGLVAPVSVDEGTRSLRTRTRGGGVRSGKTGARAARESAIPLASGGKGSAVEPAIHGVRQPPAPGAAPGDPRLAALGLAPSAAPKSERSAPSKPNPPAPFLRVPGPYPDQLAGLPLRRFGHPTDAPFAAPPVRDQLEMAEPIEMDEPEPEPGPEPEAEPEPGPETEPEPEPDNNPTERIPGSYVPPSGGPVGSSWALRPLSPSRTSRSIPRRPWRRNSTRSGPIS